MVAEDQASRRIFTSALVVEPVAFLRQIVTKFLRDNGVAVVQHCSSPVEALRLIKKFGSELVFCGSGAGAGVALVEALRWGSDTPNREITFVLIEKAPSPETVQQAKSLGIDSIIAVPFSGNVLKSRMDALSRIWPDFSVSPDYIGPDRRRSDQAIEASNRRTGSEPAAPQYSKTCLDILRDHVQKRRSGQTKPESAPDAETPCGISTLKPGVILARPCATRTGDVLAAAHKPLSAQIVMRLTDLVRAGELEDRFYLAD